MISAVTQRPRARLDILEQFVHFGEQESVVLAERYLAAVEATSRFRVKGFESYLVFYLPLEAGIDVVRVLHGARDIDRVFAQEER
jgi:plasmid stabilization system protein ParE